MESRPRADIYINLPALRKLDSMLMVATLKHEDIDNTYKVINIPHRRSFFFILVFAGGIG